MHSFLKIENESTSDNSVLSSGVLLGKSFNPNWKTGHWFERRSMTRQRNGLSIDLIYNHLTFDSDFLR
jgi:hypothetical protein